MDVVLIQWPSDEPLRIQLAQQEHPRLLLVEPGADPPSCVDVLEDWVRLPVSRADRDARITSLQQRAGHGYEDLPSVDRNGALEYRGSRAQLSQVQASVVAPLVHRFGAVVSREELSTHAWPGADASANNLDVTIGRLRRQVDKIGLRIRTVRSRGYLLCDGDNPE